MKTRRGGSWVGLSLATALPLVLSACADGPVHPIGAAKSPAIAAARGPTDPLSKINQLPASLEQKVQTLRADLETRGYDVARGYWTLWTVDDCKYSIKTVGNCYGNNPTAPYVLPAVPQWPDEFVDRALHHVIKPLQRNASVTYRLDDREALVILGVLPPPGKYFGLQTYVFSREGAINTNDPIYKFLATRLDIRALLFTLTPNPSRVLTFASIGNAINNVVIERRSGASFDSERFFIVTPDAVMEREMTEALLRAGVPGRSHVFTDSVSNQLVHVGLGRSADDLITGIRYAMPDDEVAGALWRQQLPLAVLRVRDRNTTRAVEPYPTPAYEARTALPDLAYNEDLKKLAGAVRQYWGQPAADTASFFSALGMVDLIGQHCLQRLMNCLGDTQDNDTYRISPRLTIDDGEVIAVVGALGTLTGNAMYVSMAVNRWEDLTGVANLTQVELGGTASAFAGTVSNTDRFFVYYVARDCTGLSNCLALSETIVPRGATIKLMQRNYMFPGGTRGPDALTLLNPRVVILNGAARPPSR